MGSPRTPSPSWTPAQWCPAQRPKVDSSGRSAGEGRLSARGRLRPLGVYVRSINSEAGCFGLETLIKLPTCHPAASLPTVQYPAHCASSSQSTAYTSSKLPAFTPSRKFIHSSRVMLYGSTSCLIELRISTVSPSRATSTQAPPSHLRQSSLPDDSALTTPPPSFKHAPFASAKHAGSVLSTVIVRCYCCARRFISCQS